VRAQFIQPKADGKSFPADFSRSRHDGQFLPRPLRARYGKTASLVRHASGTRFARTPVHPVLEFGMSVSSTGFSPTSVFSSQPTQPTTLTAKPAQTAEQKFLEYAKMTPAERLHAQMLAELGLTEDQFKAMSPADQQKIEDKIRDMIKKQLDSSSNKPTGMITDKSV
jgi:hypothetical protein